MREYAKLKAIRLYDEAIFEQSKKLKLIADLKNLGVPQGFIEKHTSQVLSDEEIISKIVLSLYSNAAFDQDIYVFIGGYVRFDGIKDILIEDYKHADYCLFLNIENEYDFQIVDSSNVNEFKKEHKIIMLPKSDSIKVYKKKYYELQSFYYKEMLINRKDEDEIYNELKKKYRR